MPDVPTNPRSIALGSLNNGVISTPDEVDWFAIYLTKGKTYLVNVFGYETADAPRHHDPDASIGYYNQEGAFGQPLYWGGIAAELGGEFIILKPEETTTYYIKVHKGGTDWAQT